MRLVVHAKPGSRLPSAVVQPDGTWSISVRERSVDGEANRAIVEALARALGRRRSAVRIVRGHTSRIKHVEVDQ